MAEKLTHLNEKGQAAMVDVAQKSVTLRTAVAKGNLLCGPEILAAITKGEIPKGDILACARIAGIQAAKKTDALIPLCHSLPISSASVDFEILETGVEITARITTEAKTGVEMEALTAVSVACLTLYDMAKALDKGMMIENIRLISKTGGKSGDWHRGKEEL